MARKSYNWQKLTVDGRVGYDLVASGAKRPIVRVRFNGRLPSGAAQWRATIAFGQLKTWGLLGSTGRARAFAEDTLRRKSWEWHDGCCVVA